tara:strand:- start:263 stop:1201 length:939 start_codon:yes stop_codon:yes gene_type:complete
MLKIRYIGSILIVLLGVHYFYQKSDELKQLMNLTLFQIGTAFTAIILYNLITGVKYKTIFSVFKIKLSIKEWFGLTQVMLFFNQVFFYIGTVANAYYLKKHYRLSYSKFIIATTAIKLVDLFVVALISLTFSLIFFIIFEINLYAILLFCFVLTILILLFFSKSIKTRGLELRFCKKLLGIIELWNEYKQNKSAIITLILLTLIAIPILGIRYYIAFNIVNNPISIFECIIISLVVTTASFVNIVPGNIGIRETVVGFLAYYMDHNFEYGVIATTLDRILSAISVGVLAFIFFHVLHMKGYPRQSTVISDSL